jgi:hypothetical protein
MMRFEDVGELRIRLASLLPKLARGSHLVMNGMPNEYVEVSIFSFRLCCLSKRLIDALVRYDFCRRWKT